MIRKIICRNVLLLCSFLVCLSGSAFALIYMERPGKFYSDEKMLTENNIIGTIILLTALCSLMLNLFSVYKIFAGEIKILTVFKLVFMSFPLMVWGCLLLYGWLVVNAVV